MVIASYLTNWVTPNLRSGYRCCCLLFLNWLILLDFFDGLLLLKNNKTILRMWLGWGSLLLNWGILLKTVLLWLKRRLFKAELKFRVSYPVLLLTWDKNFIWLFRSSYLLNAWTDSRQVYVIVIFAKFGRWWKYKLVCCDFLITILESRNFYYYRRFSYSLNSSLHSDSKTLTELCRSSLKNRLDWTCLGLLVYLKRPFRFHLHSLFSLLYQRFSL